MPVIRSQKGRPNIEQQPQNPMMGSFCSLGQNGPTTPYGIYKIKAIGTQEDDEEKHRSRPNTSATGPGQ